MSLHFSNDHPTAFEPTEREMTCHRGTLAPQEATQGSAHASMCGPTPSLSQMVKQTELENGRFQREVACQQQMEDTSMHFLSEVQGFLEKLQQAVNIFEDLQVDIEQDLRDITKP